jgi:SAM-dependent methyltransferase
MTHPQKALIGASPEEVRSRLGPMEPALCAICRHSRARLFGVDLYGFHIVRCETCGLLYQSPRPGYEWLIANVYADGYHQALPSAAQPPHANQHYIFARQLAQIERHVERGSLLDVGCGQGGFLAFAASRGWRIAGTEVTAPLVQWLELQLPQGKFVTGRLGEFSLGGLQFDAVRLNHVLEHTQDPARELALASELLRAGGVMYVSVPNVASLDSRMKNLLSRMGLKRRPYRHLTALHHLWFFTPPSLARLAESVGLHVRLLETPLYTYGERPRPLTGLRRALVEPLHLGNSLDACLVKT